MEVKQVYKDKESRFVIVKGMLLVRELTIASLYAPNDSSASFNATFFELLTKYHSPHMIIGGDFNMVASPPLDRSAPTAHSKSFPKFLTTKLRDSQLIDRWRAHKIGTKEYTFYSHPHSSYARLDYILSTPIILANSKDASIYTCVWSDHQITSFDTKGQILVESPHLCGGGVTKSHLR